MLQVVQATNTTVTALSNTTSYTEISGFTATITPSAATSKILVISNPSTSTFNTSFRLYLRLERSTTVLIEGDTSGSRVRTTTMGSFGDSFVQPSPMIYLDSPNTTSAITYNVKYRMGPSDAHTAYLNRSAATTDSANFATASSTFILIEIAG